jgi:hypothetical protein
VLVGPQAQATAALRLTVQVRRRKTLGNKMAQVAQGRVPAPLRGPDARNRLPHRGTATG